MWKSSLKLRQFWTTTRSGQRLACFETSRFGNQQNSQNLDKGSQNSSGGSRFTFDIKNPGYHFLLAHCTGFTKEMWIPFVEDLFKIAENNNLTSNITVTAFDFRGHGDSEINKKFSEDKLLRAKESREIIGDWTCFDEDVEAVAQEILKEYKSKNLEKPIMVGVGLSMGGSCLIVPQRKLNVFDQIALLEPIIISPKIAGYGSSFEKSPLSAATLKRKTEFPSISFAKQNFKKRFADWDERELDCYVEGLLKQEGDKAVLKRDIVFESEIYKMGGTHDIWNDLPKIEIPVFLGFGVNDSSVFKNDFTNPAAKGLYSEEEYLAATSALAEQFSGSIRFEEKKIEGTGHFMVLEKPTQVAELIYDFVNDNNSSSGFLENFADIILY